MLLFLKYNRDYLPFLYLTWMIWYTEHPAFNHTLDTLDTPLVLVNKEIPRNFVHITKFMGISLNIWLFYTKTHFLFFTMFQSLRSILQRGKFYVFSVFSVFVFPWKYSMILPLVICIQYFQLDATLAHWHYRTNQSQWPKTA